MSFREIAVTVRAYNEASVEFARVASDAGRMGEDIRAAAVSFTHLSEASNASAASMSGAVVQSHEFTVSLGEMKEASETAAVSIGTVARTLTSFAGLSTAVISLAGDLGIVDRESAKWARTILSILTITSSWIRLKRTVATLTAAHTAATAANTAAESTNASASMACAVAHKVKAAATWIAVHAQNALNISHATFLALTGVGIGVIITAAAAMAYFATQMNSATASVKAYNEVVAESPTRTRSIIRAGEEEMYRRGVE